MSMQAIPECEPSQKKNGCRGVTRPWQFALLMLCVLLLLPAFTQPATAAGPPGCPTRTLFGVAQVGLTSQLYSINPSTAATSVVGPILGLDFVSAIDFNPINGDLYVVGVNAASFIVLRKIDPCTGAISTPPVSLSYPYPPILGPINKAAGEAITDMSFRKNGSLYVYYKIPGFQDVIASVNLLTGVLTDIKTSIPLPSAVNASGNGLAWSEASTTTSSPILYRGIGNVLPSLLGKLFQVNTVTGTGAQSPVGDLIWPTPLSCAVGSGCRPNSMDFQPVTNTLYASVFAAATGNFLVTINTTPPLAPLTPRLVSFLGPLVPRFDAIAFYPSFDQDSDGVNDAVDICPSEYNPKTTWTDYLNALHVNEQPDFDLDGVGDACDNCKKVANLTQVDSDGDLIGDACETFAEQIIPPPPAPTAAPKWSTATFTNNTGAAINTIQPDCINSLFTVNPTGSPTDILPPTYRHRAYGVPDDVVNIAAGASFTVTCDVNEMFDPTVLIAGTYDVSATYSNDIDPNNDLFVGAVQSTPALLTVDPGPTVTPTTATVVYSPSTWSTGWATYAGTLPPITAVITGTGCSGPPLTIMMNGTVGSLSISGINPVTATFSAVAAVLSLGTTSPGTYSPTVQGTCSGGGLFTAKAPITLGLTVSIDIKPGSGTNPINMGSRGVVPVAIFSTPTFDATKVLPSSVTLAGGGVNLKGKGQATYQFSISDVDGDTRPDMVVQIDTTTMTLNSSMTSAVLEGLYAQDLVNGDTLNVPISGVDVVTIVP